jgi:LCP family protein required for cell wall assembly
MAFKRTSIVKKKHKTLNIIWILSILVVFVVAVFLIKNINFFDIKIDEQDVINIWNWEEEEKKWFFSSLFWKKEDKEEKQEINILLVWRWWILNDAPDLTDTIILLKANTEKKSISMLSLPRDLYVKYPWNEHFYGKINWIYQRYLYRQNSKDYGMEMLAEKITEITWEKVDYYVNVDFKWFIEIIDTLQWIVIEIPEDIIDYEYPDENWWYRTLIFRKWIWLLDWENALKYVRSRHSTSDFDRSLRQQQVISAIKDKILSTYLITSPWKIKELYEVFTKNVLTNLPLTKLLSLAYSFRNVDGFSIISSNMNDSCFYWSGVCSKWWILYVPNRELFNWMSVLLFNWTDISNLANYDLAKKYANIVLNYPWVQTEGLKVNILNSMKINNLAGTLSNDIIRYWFNITKLWNTDTEFEKTTIYYNGVPENSQTLEALKQFFNWEFIQTEIPLYSSDSANIEIVVWRDHLWKEEIFSF